MFSSKIYGTNSFLNKDKKFEAKFVDDWLNAFLFSQSLLFTFEPFLLFRFCPNGQVWPEKNSQMSIKVA